MKEQVTGDSDITVEISDIRDDMRRYRTDVVVREAEVTIKVGGRVCTRLFCLPSDFEELATGYLRSEGFDTSYVSKIEVEAVGPEIFEILVALEKKVWRKPCKVVSGLKIKREEVFRYAKELDECGLIFKKTGGTHVVACFDLNFNRKRDGLFVEDVSRHCAIDKLIGICSKNGTKITGSVLVTSCRQSRSTMKKAISAGFPVVISVSAPTHLAIRDAAEFGVTLVGFARDNRFNVYTHEWRIL